MTIKISNLIDAILNPTIPSIERMYYSNTKTLDIMDGSCNTVCNVQYEMTDDNNFTQYSSRYSKCININKHQNGVGGEYIIHTAKSKVERNHSNYDILRISYDGEFDSQFFQYSLIANVNGDSIWEIEKIVKITKLLLESPIEVAKITFYALSKIEIDKE